MNTEADLSFMRQALALAETRLGRTWPNPTVGCVVVKDGAVVAEGVTGEGGRPHGEEVALAAAGGAARGAAAYIALEPCAKRSSSGLSCTDRLIASGLARVVVAIEDPHANAGGAGLARLKAAGVQVEMGVCAAEAAALNAGFISRVVNGMPLVAADSARDRYDAVFAPAEGEDFRVLLRRMGTVGLTRLCVPPDGDLARRLEQEGLLSVPYRSG